MVSKYQRKSQQQSWDPKAMQRAIDAVKNDNMAWLTAAKQFNVPRNTLKRRVLEENQQATSNKKCLGRYRAVFTKEQEQELVNYLLDMEIRFFGITVADLRSLAYQLAVKNNIPNTFNHTKKLAGKDWVAGFRKRHREIVLRKPEATSAARAQAFNKTNVSKFFDILEDAQKNYLYPPHRVYNVDETGLLTVQSKSSKVFALKGRRQVGSLTSAERGTLSTFVVCMSAGGNFIPPFVIFPRQRMKEELKDGAPPGTTFCCHPSGWMQSEIFIQWFEHFLKYAKPSREDPVLLILDGHATHTKNLDFIVKARDTYTTVVCLPPHCTHKLQPLDVSFMGPLNTYYVQAVERFLRNNPGRVVTQYQVSRLLGEAFLNAATPTIAVKGFRRCGIVPINRNVFSEDEFAPAATTDISNPLTEVPPADVNCESQDSDQDETNYDKTDGRSADSQPNNSIPVVSFYGNNKAKITVGSGDPNSAFVLIHEKSSRQVTSSAESTLIKPSISSAVNLLSTPSTSSARNKHALPSSSSSFAVSPKDILPIPKTNITKRKSIRKKGTSAILTSSPYKNELEAAKEEREEKERQKKIKLDIKNEKKDKKKKEAKKREIAGKNKSKSMKRVLFEDSDDSDHSDTECLFCGEYFSKSREREGWIKCSNCQLWAHEACAGCEEEDNEFICDICR